MLRRAEDLALYPNNDVCVRKVFIVLNRLMITTNTSLRILPTRRHGARGKETRLMATSQKLQVRVLLIRFEVTLG